MAYLGNNNLPFDPTRTAAQPRDAERFSGNGSTTNFTLSRVPPNGAIDVTVYVENVAQEPITAYSVVGNSLNFTEAPPSGTYNIYVVYRNTTGSQVVMPDGSVSYNKLANNLRLFTTDNLIPNGNTVAFTLSEPPADANTVFVSVDGVMQRAPVHYTTSGSTITFTSAPPTGSNVHVRHLGFRTTQTLTAIAANTTIPQATLQSPAITGTVTLVDVALSNVIGIGSTANTNWATGRQVIEFDTGASLASYISNKNIGAMAISRNWIYDTGGVNKYQGASSAQQFYLNSTGFNFLVADTGSAGGAISYSTAMQIVSTGTGIGSVRIPYQPAFLASLQSAVSLSGSGWVATTGGSWSWAINSGGYNVGSNYVPSTNRFTAPVAGMYLFFANCYAATAGSNMGFRFSQNAGAQVYYGPVMFTNGQAGIASHISYVVKMAAGDYMDLQVGYNPTGSLDGDATSYSRTNWGGYLLG